MCGLFGSLFLAADAEVRLLRAPTSREVERGCLGAMTPFCEGLKELDLPSLD